MEKVKRIYIAGKVSGLPWIEVSMKFGSYQKLIKNQGHSPIVPLDLCDKDDAWHIAMRKCITALILCDEVHFLPCWKDSPGARMEHMVAHQLQIPIVEVGVDYKIIKQ